MPRLLISIFLLTISFYSYSQFSFSEAEIIVQSRHVWRGDKLGTAPAIEPSVTFSGGRLRFNAWASVTTNNSYSEVDLIPSYQFKLFSVTLLDYYNPIPGEDNYYLNFQDSLNRHSVELTIDNYTIEKQRLKWMIGTFLFGDKNEETGNPYFSTYLELKYPFTMCKIEIAPFCGLTPFKGFYADRFAVINTGISMSKSFKISSKLSLPINASYIFNPNQNNHFFVVTFRVAMSLR